MAIAKLSIDLETRLASFEKDLKQMSSLSEATAGKIGKAFTGLTVVFAGLAGALSVGAIKQAFDSYVQGAAAMDDLAEITGSTVEKVSALANVAKVSGTDMACSKAAWSSWPRPSRWSATNRAMQAPPSRR